jgi:glycosyltransferase involved in cell wall biosynthesis
LPSYFEGNPKVLLEAMSCEMVCLASDIEEHTTIIEDSKNGFICGTSADEIKDKLSFIFNNLDKFSEVGKYARETILDRYSMDKNSDREVEIYEMLLDKNE